MIRVAFISQEGAEKKLISARNINKLPKAIVVVHMCDNHVHEENYQLSKRFNFKIIEDASHAIGDL